MVLDSMRELVEEVILELGIGELQRHFFLFVQTGGCGIPVGCPKKVRLCCLNINSNQVNTCKNVQI